MVSVHKLFGVINKPNWFNVSEHQDGAIRILFQLRTCDIYTIIVTTMMNTNKSINMTWAYPRWTSTSGVLMCICFCLRVPDDTRDDWMFSFNRMRFNM